MFFLAQSNNKTLYVRSKKELQKRGNIFFVIKNRITCKANFYYLIIIQDVRNKNTFCGWGGAEMLKAGTSEDNLNCIIFKHLTYMKCHTNKNAFCSWVGAETHNAGTQAGSPHQQTKFTVEISRSRGLVKIFDFRLRHCWWKTPTKAGNLRF